jgi:hypothetical protein
VTRGNATAAGTADAARRSPNEPVSTTTWSTVAQLPVPGWQTVTVTKGVLKAEPSVPPSTTIGATFMAAGAGAGAGAGEEDGAGAGLPDPPPPQPVRNTARKAIASEARTSPLQRGAQDGAFISRPQA